MHRAGEDKGGGERPRTALVSAVIPAFNAEAYLAQAIESVLAQSYSRVECIVVDDGSTDSTTDVACLYAPRIQLVRQANRGVAAARNRGAARARGELLAFLDADDRWLPERIERQLEAMEARPGTEAVVCATEVTDRDLRPRDIIRQAEGVTLEDLLLCRASVVSTSSNLLVTRECFEAFGGWDEHLSTSADWALMFRLVERGGLATIPDALVQYRLHDSNMSASVPRFERDMLTAFGDVLAGPGARAELQPLRARAYANLHRMIAGSYFVERSFGAFARHAALSVRSHPSTLPYLLGMPLRRLRRALSARGRPPTNPPAAGRPRA